jgi:hypothetical protein
VDNGWDRWFMLVMPGDRPDALTLQPQVADNITWWKHLEVYASVMGVFLHITTLATANETRSSTVDITATDAPMTDVLKLDFWKVGPFGVGSFVFSLGLYLPSYIGNKTVYLCNRDSYSLDLS